MDIDNSAIAFFEDEVEAFLFISDFPGLQALVRQIITDNHCQLQGVNVVFLDDEALRAINQRYLQHDYYTDVITFDLSETEASIEGEIYISLERVIDNAFDLGSEVSNELERVVIHGALHLVGYSDKGEVAAATMRSAETYYLQRLNTDDS